MLAAIALAASPSQGRKAAPLKGPSMNGARVLIVAPHPDDAVLAASGLVQRSIRRGGHVRVVFMTSGDGYAPGVTQATGSPHPGPDDFRAYARRREREAAEGLSVLGLARRDLVFLGFPDRGLCPILSRYRADHPPYYRSPFTEADRPPTTESLGPSVEYDAADLDRELRDVIVRFRPTLIVVPHPADEHPDHCATYFFVREALDGISARPSAVNATVVAYLLHFDGWPDAGPGPLRPPRQLEQRDEWVSVPLSASGVAAKRIAIGRYRTQMDAMASYLLEFVRQDELFALGVGERDDAARLRCCQG